MEAEQTAFLGVLLLTTFILIATGLGLYVVFGRGSSRSKTEPEEEHETQAAGGRRARRQRDRMRAGLTRRRPAQGHGDGGGQAEAEEDNGSDSEPLTRKEAKKKAQREAREAREAAQEARENKKNAYEERRRAKEAEREAREAAEEAERAAAEEERRRKEDEEAAKWMNFISVDEAGTQGEEAGGEEQGMLGRFVDFIKQRKAVPLDEVAAEFGLRVTEVINRLHALEEGGQITGVMDDRGKYIYISMEEMHAVADFITNRGRVSISDLAKNSNMLVDLEAKVTAGSRSGALDLTLDALDDEDDAEPDAPAVK